MKSFVALAAFAALSLPASAQARADLSPEATQAAVRYALPHLLSGVRATCAPKLSSTGYLATNGAALLARYSNGSEAAWPAARTALMALGADTDKSDMVEMFSKMPDSALKPFVDATISSMIATKIKPANCGDIERGLELLAPLPPENIAGIAGFLFDMTRRDKKTGSSQGG
ncbi:hypothetical protein GCM10011515_10440 [Tsuneonella deserti]|uniref:Uncharacterized protein n=1 Tax=Tsuneonella deserti TaxID=2035528 RepID=A0ABQ1S647_9SPHN|nr:hypothetical protein [Tsuneonella deserti]GGD92641.1 hypothetical protein GCM10011515_10440 [Tsuneonella deserti]